MTTPTPDHAYEAGRYARQAARGRDTCPRYGITPQDRPAGRPLAPGLGRPGSRNSGPPDDIAIRHHEDDHMTPAEAAERCRQQVALLCELDSPPMTSRELLERRELIAREYARAEARRQTSPQLNLEG